MPRGAAPARRGAADHLLARPPARSAALQIDDSDRRTRKDIQIAALTGSELSALPDDTPVYKAAGKA